MGTKKRKHRWLKYITVITITACVAGALIFWAFLHTPAAYTPLPADNPDQVSLYLTHELGPDFFNQVQLGEPFELIIEQDGLNDIIRGGIWPQQCGPATVDTPMVVFDSGIIYAMSKVSYMGFSSVLTVVSRPTQDKTGQINMHIDAVRLGLLPVTPLAAGIAKSTMGQFEADLQEWPELAKVLSAVIANAAFEPVFEVPKHRIRVHRFQLEQGRLRVVLVPLSPDAASANKTN